VENKLLLEVQLATGIEISLVGARAWLSRVVVAAAMGEMRPGGCHQSVSKDSHQTFTFVLP